MGLRLKTGAIAFALLISVSNSSFALSTFSRACRWSWIPKEFQYAASLLFAQMAKRGAHILPLPYQRVEEQAKWWVLESITTDYGKARYYLFANARVYQTYYVNIPGTNSFRWEYRPTQSFYLSPNGWDSLTINPEMYGDKRLDIFLHNRHLWFSARAGHPDIVEKFNDTKSVLAVAGVHFYYDPKIGQTRQLPNSAAVDCNLSQWGFEHS